MKRTALAFIAALSAAPLLATEASAEPWRGHERPYERYEDHHRGPPHDPRAYGHDPFFSEQEAYAMQRFYGPRLRYETAVHAPDWRRPYLIGRPLPPHVQAYAPHPRLARRLPPPPRGHYYRQVDRDLLVISARTGRVVDALIVVR